ncbi:MAG: hypothetical protein WD651_08505, partial [Acidimicrobiia bacterium]
MSPRRWSSGFGGPTRPPFLVGVALATLLALGACSATGSAESTTTASTAAPSTSLDPPSTSASASTSITTSTTLRPTEDVLDAWGAYWDAWAEVRASDDLDSALLDAVASPNVVDGAISLFKRQRSSGLGPVETEVALHPIVLDLDADRATLEDCVLLAPSFTDAVGVWFEADLTRSEQGWIVDAIRIPRAGGCIPGEMAEASIAGYQAYYEAEAEFWNPANPLSPLLDEVLAEPQKSFIVGLLEQHQAQGVALRGQPTTHP